MTKKEKKRFREMIVEVQEKESLVVSKMGRSVRREMDELHKEELKRFDR